jgi:hypothetical protein
MNGKEAVDAFRLGCEQTLVDGETSKAVEIH